jgi:hypothetical protein
MSLFFLYCIANICETPGRSIDKLMQDNLLPIVPEDPNDFRVNYLYTEEVGNIFADHMVMVSKQTFLPSFLPSYILKKRVLVSSYNDKLTY